MIDIVQIGANVGKDPYYLAYSEWAEEFDISARAGREHGSYNGLWRKKG